MDRRGVSSPPPGRALGERVAKGAAWIVAARFLVRALGLLNTIVLARLLTPNDFGLVALGLVTLQLLQNTSDIGVAQTVVRFRHAERRHYDTLFTLSLLRGLAIAALLAAVSMPAAEFYGDPRARWVFLGVAPAPLFLALVNPRYYEFERALDFSREFLVSGVNKLVGVAVSIAVAVTFRTYWAIILGFVAGAFAQMALSYVVRAYRPRFSLSAFRELIAFTGWMTGVSFMAALNNKLDLLVLSKIVGEAKAGAYYVGDSLAMLASQELAEPIAKALYPGLSELQDKQRSMRAAYLRGVEALAFVAMPASFGAAFVATDLTSLLLGEGWERAIPVIEAFAPMMGVWTLFSATQAYAMAQGRTQLIFWREFIFFLIRMPIYIWAAVNFGVAGAILAAAIGLGVHSLLNLGLYARLSGRSAVEPLWRARRPIAGVAAMAAYFMLAREWIGIDAVEALPARLSLDVTAGAGVYAAAIGALWRLEGEPDGIERVLAKRLQTFRSARAPIDSARS